ncbi:hypothetical protein ACO1NB_13690, partial [Staphylococcus aureus]
LRGGINERLGYRDALNLGRTLVECRQANLNNAAQVPLLDILERALSRRLSDNKAEAKPHPAAAKP